jgi:FixJ family two-component response regulator
VLDVTLPGLSGLELQERLAERTDMPIIFITGHGDVSLAVQAMRAGAIDFIEKPFRDQYLLERINQALQLDCDRQRERVERAAIQARLAHLTPREREVMERIVQGKSNKVVAMELGLSERTVEIHRAKVMTKAGVRSLPELVSMLAKGVSA